MYNVGSNVAGDVLICAATCVRSYKQDKDMHVLVQDVHVVCIKLGEMHVLVQN